jgi:hypothetical protein
MANWSNPQLTSTYTNFVTEVKDRDVDLALQFDGTTSTNIPTNTIRWNSSINRWQKWSGSAWGELTSTYALNALSVSGTTSLATATATTVATADNSTNIATTAWVKAQNYLTSVAGSYLPLSGGTITGNLSVGGTLAANSTFIASNLNGGAFGFRNKIINGDFSVDQYNNGSLINPFTNNQYFIDRWVFILQGSASIKGQRNYNSGTVGAPTGFTNYFGFENNSAYTVTGTDNINFQHRIEANNLETWAWGTGSAVDVMLSFRVRASVAGTYAVSIQDSGSTYSYVTSFSIPAGGVNTWTSLSLKIPGPTAGTWLTGTNVGARIRFTLGVNTNLQTATTNAWQTGNYQAPTGAVSWVGTAGATFYITGVQLEACEATNGLATEFELPPYSTRLALCQRYYYAATQYVGPTTAITSYTHPVAMRATPTRTGGGSGYSATLLDANGVAHSQTTAGSQSMTYSAEL